MASRKLQRRAVGYVRVSVDNERKVSPEIQAEAITKLCAAKGWDLPNRGCRPTPLRAITSPTTG